MVTYKDCIEFAARNNEDRILSIQEYDALNEFVTTTEQHDKIKAYDYYRTFYAQSIDELSEKEQERIVFTAKNGLVIIYK